MTAVVSESRAKSMWLTGSAGLLILLAAFVMMVCAAPSSAHTPTRAVTQSATAHHGQPTPHTVFHARVRVMP